MGEKKIVVNFPTHVMHLVMACPSGGAEGGPGPTNATIRPRTMWRSDTETIRALRVTLGGLACAVGKCGVKC